MPSSFEKTNHCVCDWDSQSRILAQEEGRDLQSGDPWLSGHGQLPVPLTAACLLIRGAGRGAGLT